jgi:hypothetical protein
VLDTAYVGSRSWHQQQKVNLNAIPYGATFMPANQDPTKASPGQIASNPALLNGSNALPADFLRSYAGYGDIAIHEAGGTANYNSLQISLNHNFAHGLQFGFAYTYGKALGTSSADGDYNRIDNLERFANYGPLSFDRRHTVAINYVYQIPSLFTSHAFLHSTLDGWQVSGITRMQTGTPYEVGFSLAGYNNQNLTGSYTEPPRVQIAGDPLNGTSARGQHRYRRGPESVHRPRHQSDRSLAIEVFRHQGAFQYSAAGRRLQLRQSHSVQWHQ